MYAFGIHRRKPYKRLRNPAIAVTEISFPTPGIRAAIDPAGVSPTMACSALLRAPERFLSVSPCFAGAASPSANMFGSLDCVHF